MSEVNFGVFEAYDAKGVLHKGAQPSTLEKPLQGVKAVIGGVVCYPTVEKGEDVIQVRGQDYSIKVVMAEDGTGEEHFYRMVSLMADGRKWSTLYDKTGTMVEVGWL